MTRRQKLQANLQEDIPTESVGTNTEFFKTSWDFDMNVEFPDLSFVSVLHSNSQSTHIENMIVLFLKLIINTMNKEKPDDELFDISDKLLSTQEYPSYNFLRINHVP